jgi:hypothetical protein
LNNHEFIPSSRAYRGSTYRGNRQSRSSPTGRR